MISIKTWPLLKPFVSWQRTVADEPEIKCSKYELLISVGTLVVMIGWRSNSPLWYYDCHLHQGLFFFQVNLFGVVFTIVNGNVT